MATLSDHLKAQADREAAGWAECRDVLVAHGALWEGATLGDAIDWTERELGEWGCERCPHREWCGV